MNYTPQKHLTATKTPDKTAQNKLLGCRGDAYILVAEVEDKLFDAAVLPPRSGRLRQSDVELEGGVGSQVSEVTWSTDLNARLPVKLHGNADLDGGERAKKTLEAAGGQTLLIMCVCVCVCVYLAGGVSRLLDELTDAVDVLGDVRHLCRVILQFVELLHQQGNRLAQRVN